MLDKLAIILSNYYIKKNKIDEEEKEIYVYSFEILLSTILNFLALMIFAILTKTYFEAIIFTIIFISLRGCAGGYHANTHLGCLLCLLLVYSGLVLFVKFLDLNNFKNIFVIFSFIAGVTIMIISPIDNINNRLDILKKQKYKKRAIKYIIALFIVMNILYFMPLSINFIFSISYTVIIIFLFQIFQVLIDIIKNNK